MQFLDERHTIAWLSERGLTDTSGLPSFAGFVEALDSRIPGDSGRKTALSRVIASFFKADDEALLWIDEYGIWPSCEDPFLFEGFRRCLGEASPLYEKPGHIFSREDIRAVSSLVALVLYFNWGAILVSPKSSLAIRISHDEFITVWVRKSGDAAHVVRSLESML